MRKFFFLLVCVCSVLSTKAQIFLNETFDNWQGNLPVNWTLYNYDEVATVEISPVADRNGQENKACRVNTLENIRDGSTWHVSFRNIDDLFLIPKDAEYYYTFWAKSDVQGTEMWIGLEENYDQTKVNGGNWWEMPKIELTTEWKQYAYQEKALAQEVKRFTLQLRTPGIRYIDDILLACGTEIPSGIKVINSNNNSLVNILPSMGGLEFNSVNGEISVYDTTGRELISGMKVEDGNNFIPLQDGLYIVRFKSGSEQVTLKALVR